MVMETKNEKKKKRSKLTKNKTASTDIYTAYIAK